MSVLKVSAKSNPNSIAGALAGFVRENGTVEIQAIGAGALNQAIKAIAIARGFVAPSGIELICIPAFTDVEIDGVQKTAMNLLWSREEDNVLKIKRYYPCIKNTALFWAVFLCNFA